MKFIGAASRGCILTVFLAAAPLFAADSGEPRLVLPPIVFSVPGATTEIVFQNAVLPEPESPFSFTVACGIGTAKADRWILDSTEVKSGDYPLTLSLKSPDGNKIDEASTTIRVVPGDSGVGAEIALLIVGDSLTNASQYPNEIARLLSSPGNPKWAMLGTHHPASAAENVFHEGYGGWSWARFNSRFEPNQPQTGKTRSSPFLFADTGEPEKPPRLNVARYFKDSCNGRMPDFAIFLLGINDCFHVDPDDPAAVEARIDWMLSEAETLLAAFQKSAPNTELGICLTPPPNTRDEAFEINYKGRYPRWGWRRIQYRLVERQIAHFRDRESEKIFIVPTSLNVDPTAGYPENNGVHPNAAGYRQIASAIHAWLKWRLAEKD